MATDAEIILGMGESHVHSGEGRSAEAIDAISHAAKWVGEIDAIVGVTSEPVTEPTKRFRPLTASELDDILAKIDKMAPPTAA